MANAQWALMRAETRLEVLPVEVKGLLNWPAKKSQQVPFLLWDISNRGLGLLLSDPLQAGEEVQVTFGSPVALSQTCRVVWCQAQIPDYDFQDSSYRCGLLTVSNDAPFRKLLEVIENLRKK